MTSLYAQAAATRQALESLRVLIDSQIELEPWRVKKREWCTTTNAQPVTRQ